MKLLRQFFFFVFFSEAISLAAEKVTASGEGKEELSTKGNYELEKLSKRNKCCKLGREVAKIGDVCSYEESSTALKPNPKHYHVMKTRLWTQDGANPISTRKLEKCKRFKAYYEKCCRTESANIARDIERLRKALKRFLRDEKAKSNLDDQPKSSGGSGDSGEKIAVLMIDN